MARGIFKRLERIYATSAQIRYLRLLNNRGRSTAGGPAVPCYALSQHIEAAKHLRLTVTRYIADRASLADVEDAMTMLRACAPVAGERGHRTGGR